MNDYPEKANKKKWKLVGGDCLMNENLMDKI
jgi:hypothetical protein